jgi:chemotaxis protein methyltransferase CheR
VGKPGGSRGAAMIVAAEALRKASSYQNTKLDPLIQIRDLIYNAAGIFQADNKLQLLEDRCRRRMKMLGIPTLHEYYNCLTVNSMRQAEMVSLLNEITIGETYFFRNLPQLEAIRKIVLPAIVEAKTKTGQNRLRIWSAGCSTGEEPFTIAMILLDESAARLKGWITEITATDLNERSISHARTGIYGEYSTRNLDSHFRNKYFRSAGDKLQLNEEVQSKVVFSRNNLLDDSRMPVSQGIDLILCCNVLIYFDVASKQRVLHQFSRILLPHGYLFLGHSESLYGISEDFRLVHLPSATAYVKSENAGCDRGEP